MITAIKSKYIVKYAREKLGKTDADIAALFTGPRSMNHRLVMLKNAIETNPKYTRLRGNHFINQIYSELEENGTVVRGKLVEKPGFITVLDNVDDSRVNSDLLIDGWEDLLNDEDTFVRKFARDMIVYSFLTSGEFKGWNKLFKFVPPAWIRGEIDTDFQSFADFIQQALTMSASDYNGMLDEIVSNNFMDYRLARRVPQKNPEDKSDNFIDVTSIIKVGRSVDEDQMNSVEKYITIKEDMYAGKNVAGYSLFKLQGFLPSQKGWHPVYARMKKKGYHGKTGRDVYEYGWTFGYPENENEAFVEFDQTVALQRVAQYLSMENVGYDESSARAITDVYLGRIEPEDAVPSNNGEQEDVYTMNSGGAPGSDTVWGEIAAEYGITNQNHWYHGQTSSTNAPGGNIQIYEHDYEEGKTKVAQAAKMNWGYQYNTMKDDRLVRNWAQVKYSDAVFAIGHLVNKG
jgi:hypothetical protein